MTSLILKLFWFEIGFKKALHKIVPGIIIRIRDLFDVTGSSDFE